MIRSSCKPMDKLKAKRKEKGYTQSQLAEMVGVVQNSISQYEAGVCFPKRDTIVKLAEVLECDVGELI